MTVTDTTPASDQPTINEAFAPVSYGTDENVNEDNHNTGNTTATGNATARPDLAITEFEESPRDRLALYKKALAGLILLGFIVFVIVDSQQNNYIKNGIVAFLEWIENNIVAGVFCFIAVYFLATILWVPGSILTLGAGFVFSSALNSLGWGILLGTGAVWVGASLGAIAAFLIGRYLFRDVVGEYLSKNYKVFEALDKAFEDQGLKISVLCRLSPIIPFNAFNYGMGVTAVKFRDYVLACIAMLPGTILYVFFGAAAGSLTEIGGGDNDNDDNGDDKDSPSNNRAVTITIVVVGVVFGILAIGVIVWYAKKELDKILEKPEEESADLSGSDEENVAAAAAANTDDDETPATDANEERSM